jgi:hypothetical protein
MNGLNFNERGIVVGVFSENYSMKQILSSVFALMISLSSIAQDQQLKEPPFTVTRSQQISIVKEKVLAAKDVMSLIPEYPSMWILQFVSNEVKVFADGKEISATGSGPEFTDEQKALMLKADLGSRLTINIQYKGRNAVTEESENCTMHFTANIVPTAEAEFKGGLTELTSYMKENVSSVFPANAKNFRFTVKFKVKENGEVGDVHLKGADLSSEIYSSVVEAMKAMPHWVPAKDSNGNFIEQEFELNINSGSGGC